MLTTQETFTVIKAYSWVPFLQTPEDIQIVVLDVVRDQGANVRQGDIDLVKGMLKFRGNSININKAAYLWMKQYYSIDNP